MQTALRNTKPASTVLFSKRVFLPLILLGGLLLRLYHIDQPYTDLAGWRESSMAMMADNFYHRNPNIFFPEVSWNGPGESYNGREFQTVTYISSLLYRILGQHEWVGRIVAVVFGVWGIFALYQAVRRIWDERRALAAAAVLAFMPAGIYFDRSFLPDPAMVSLVITSVWMLLAYLQTSKRLYLFLTALFACWGFLTKITGMIVLLPMLYAVIAILQKQRKFTASNIAQILLPGLLVFATVTAYYLWARYLSLHYPPYHFAGAENWLWDDGFGAWLRQRFFLRSLRSIFQNWTLGWPVILLFVAGIFTVLIEIKRKTYQAGNATYAAPYFFHFWLFGCGVFYVIGAKELVNNFWNFHIWTPMIAAFCGNALIFFGERLLKRKTLAIALSLLFGIWVVSSNRQRLQNMFTDKYYKSDYRMGIRLRTLREPGDLVAVVAREVGSPIAIFYSGGRGWLFPPAGKGNWVELPPTDAACITTLDILKKNGAKWFGVYRDQYNIFQTSYPQFAAYLQQYPLRAQEPDYLIFQLASDNH